MRELSKEILPLLYVFQTRQIQLHTWRCI